MRPADVPSAGAFLPQTFRLELTNGVVGGRVWRCGSEEAPALVLLHGFTGSSTSWEHIAPRFAGRRTVVAIDLPGHGATSIDLGDDAFPTTARAVDETLAVLGLSRVVVWGYSMGGRIALYAVTAGHLPRAVGLVSEAASIGIADPKERTRRRRADEALAAFIVERGIEAFVDRWEQTPVLASQQALPQAVREELRRRRLACRPEGLATALVRLGAGAQPYLGDRLADLYLPALFLAGAADDRYATNVRIFAQTAPDARAVIIEGAGHCVHLERPDEVTAAVEAFLAALDAHAPRASNART